MPVWSACFDSAGMCAPPTPLARHAIDNALLGRPRRGRPCHARGRATLHTRLLRESELRQTLGALTALICEMQPKSRAVGESALAAALSG
jgi:hypothetical protein